MKRHTSNSDDSGKRYRWFLTCFLASVALLLLAMSGRASAANIVVDSLTDNATGGCELREAIDSANSNANSGGCVATNLPYGADTITFSVAGTIILGSTLNIIDADGLTINGGSQVAISGDGSVRVFLVAFPAVLALENLTVKDGKSTSNGGGVSNGSTLTITNSTLSGNLSGNDGGGILNGGTLTIANSTLSENSAKFGGGISNDTGGIVTITNSTLSGNSAVDGGGILNGGTLTITNSTLSGNEAAIGGGIVNVGTVAITNSTLSGNLSVNAGGGIHNVGDATITNSTLSGNSAAFAAFDGGGISNTSLGTVAIKNSIFNNLSGGNCNNAGTFFADVSDLATDNTCPGFAEVTSTELNLDALADNGGPTQTHALLPGSPAIDAADDSVCPEKDQRGFDRGLLCDIGAFEFVPGPPPPPPAQADVSIAKSAVKTVKTGKSLTYTIQVTNNGPDLASTVVVNDTLPLGTTFVNLTNPGAICTPLFVGSTGTLSCSYASLTSGSSVTLTLVVKVTAKGNGTNITNTATVSSATFDPNLANNSATATTKLGK